MFSPSIPEGYPAIEGVYDDQTAYVDLNTSPPSLKWKMPAPFVANKGSILANLTDTAFIGGIPENTFVDWPDGTREVVNDGSIEYVTDMPGAKNFVINAVQYLPLTITIEAI